MCARGFALIFLNEGIDMSNVALPISDLWLYTELLRFNPCQIVRTIRWAVEEFYLQNDSTWRLTQWVFVIKLYGDCHVQALSMISIDELRTRPARTSSPGWIGNTQKFDRKSLINGFEITAREKWIEAQNENGCGPQIMTSWRGPHSKIISWLCAGGNGSLLIHSPQTLRIQSSSLCKLEHVDSGS